MEPMLAGWLVFFGLMSTMLAGVFIILSALRHRAQSLEMAHRERMAMIEKGVVPSPEMNPGHAAWAAGRGPQVTLGPALHDVPAAQRSMTLGIAIVAIGLGFMSIIGVAADSPEVAFGIGGAIVVVGVAFIVISQVKRTATSHFQVPQPPPVVRPPSIPDRPGDSNP